MAQYGRNFYGASYNGSSGVFAGQFGSDKTVLFTELHDLVFDVKCNLTYPNYQYDGYNGDIHRWEGEWIDTGISKKTSDPLMQTVITLSGAEFVIHAVKRSLDGGIAKVKATRYYNGIEAETITKLLNTKIASSIGFPEAIYGDYIIEISFDATSPANGVFEFNSLTLLADDISLEIKTCNVSTPGGPEVWSEWARIPLTKTYDPLSSTYTLTSGTITEVVDETATVNIVGSIGYEFKLLMASSDDQTSPEVLALDIHTSNIESYAPKGLWKMVIDLGFNDVNVDDITFITYDADVPLGTALEIRTRVSDDVDLEDDLIPEEEISWSDWTVPYSKGLNRIVIDSKTDSSITSAVLYSPLIMPQNLSYWQYFIPQLFINYKDPARPFVDDEKVMSNHSSIKVELIDVNLKLIRLADIWGSEDEAKFIFKKPLMRNRYFDALDGTALELGEDYSTDSIIVMKIDPVGNETLMFKDIDYEVVDESTIQLTNPILENEKVCVVQIVNTGRITTPVRLKITLSRDVNYLTPALELVDMLAEAEYTEVKVFGKNKIESYASAIFGDNTGVDKLYTDGIGRTIMASVFNLNFQLPSMERITGPIAMPFADYKIINEKLLPGHAQNIDIYWNTTNGKISNENADYLVASVKADNLNIKRHIQYGSGISMSVDGEDASEIHNITGIFFPPLTIGKSYAYYLNNGHTDSDTINTNVNIRWKTENEILTQNRRNIVYAGGQEVYTSIIEAMDGKIVDWKSSEIIMEGIVNAGSLDAQVPYKEKLITRLPEIPSDAIIVEDNPYKIEIIPNSVISEGEIKEDSRINLYLDNTINEYEKITENKVLFFRGPSNTNQDFLPKSNTTNVSGIYTSLNSITPTYWEGTHFTIKDGKIIDWSLMMLNPNYVGPKPVTGDKLYITFSYNRITTIKTEATCDYNRNDYSMMDIFRTKDAKEFEGRCSLGVDYVSDVIDIESLWDIPLEVDKTTLKLKPVITSNPLIRAYIKDSKVVATLGSVNPRETWHPQIKEGFYYLGKNNYYLFTSPNEQPMDRATIPKAENVIYTNFLNNKGVVLQEPTTNLLSNGSFKKGDNKIEVFKDTFER